MVIDGDSMHQYYQLMVGDGIWIYRLLENLVVHQGLKVWDMGEVSSTHQDQV